MDIYNTDPLICRAGLKVCFGTQLLNAVSRVERALPKLTLPFLLLQGSADRLCDSRGAYLLMESAKSQDKTLKVSSCPTSPWFRAGLAPGEARPQLASGQKRSSSSESVRRVTHGRMENAVPGGVVPRCLAEPGRPLAGGWGEQAHRLCPCHVAAGPEGGSACSAGQTATRGHTRELTCPWTVPPQLGHGRVDAPVEGHLPLGYRERGSSPQVPHLLHGCRDWRSALCPAPAAPLAPARCATKALTCLHCPAPLRRG